MRLVGINHVALEVGDIEQALDWYDRFFEFELRGRHGGRMAFIDMGDQFLALSATPAQQPDRARHFGLVVDDKEAVRDALRRDGVDVRASGSGSSAARRHGHRRLRARRRRHASAHAPDDPQVTQATTPAPPAKATYAPRRSYATAAAPCVSRPASQRLPALERSGS